MLIVEKVGLLSTYFHHLGIKMYYFLLIIKMDMVSMLEIADFRVPCSQISIKVTFSCEFW